MNHLQKSQPVHGRAPDLPHRPDAKPMLAAMAQGRVGPGGFPGSSILTKRQDGTQVDKQRLKGIKKINKHSSPSQSPVHTFLCSQVRPGLV